MTLVAEARVANDEVCILGEGPVWDALRSHLLWVDVRRGIVFLASLGRDGVVRIVDQVALDQTVGAVAVSRTGEWIIAGATSLLKRSTDGKITTGIDIVTSGTGRRLNDGKADPQGAFLVGTLSLEGSSEGEVLTRTENDGTVTVIDSDLTLSNGLGWSGNGHRLYSVDTMRRVIYVRQYDSATGRTGPREVFVRFKEGYPDGICLDAADHVWVAMWGLGQVHRYSQQGELVLVVEVPAPHVSSVAFAGPLLDTLIITTATQDLSALQLKNFPHSGRLFSFDANILGMPSHAWNGIFTTNEQGPQ